jgi:hypothetical protein
LTRQTTTFVGGFFVAISVGCGDGRGAPETVMRPARAVGFRVPIPRSAELVDDSYFPLSPGWRWTYTAAGAGVEHRETIGLREFQGMTAWTVRAWQSTETDALEDVALTYFVEDANGVSLLGTTHADAQDPTATDTLVYAPPVRFAPADMAGTPTMTTEGTVRLMVTASDGTVTQDTTIPWSSAGKIVAEHLETPAGAYDVYRISFSAERSIAFGKGVGIVDLGSGRLLTSVVKPTK